MKFLKRIQNKTIVIFFLSLIITVPSIVAECELFSSQSGFDRQAFLAWGFSKHLGLVPYKDIFFPYGPLFYFNQSVLLFQIAYVVLGAVLFTTIYYILQKIYQNNWFGLLSWGFIVAFVYRFTGFEVFIRYGILVSASMVLALKLSSEKRYSKKFIALLGIFSGVIFNLVPDQGLYLLVLYVFYLLGVFLLEFRINNFLHEGYTFFLWGFFYLVAGFFVGFCASALLLREFINISSFLNFFRDIFGIVLLAKTPFISNLKTPDNLFTLTFLFFALSYIGYSFIYQKPRNKLVLYELIFLSIALVILEQKSIIRSIDRQLSFIGFIFYIVLFSLVKNVIEKNQVSRMLVVIYFVLVNVSILFVFHLNSSYPASELFHYFFRAGFKEIFLNKNNCSSTALSSFILENKGYKDVVSTIKNYSGTDPKIFSFPGDPIFYILFNQTPPYFFSIYEASGLNQQQRIIDYIKRGKVYYLVLNVSTESIQDKVPDFVRGSFLLKFLLNNFSYNERIGNFLVLSKNDNADFFRDTKGKLLNNSEQFLSIDLNAIPRSQGLSLIHSITDEKFKKEVFSSEDSLNLHLRTNAVSSRDLVIVVEGKDQGPADGNTVIEIETTDNFITTVRFKSCTKNQFCILNFERIPLFFRPRVLESVKVKTKNSYKFILSQKLKSDLFW